MSYPEIYADIMTAGEKTPLEKYAATYQGAQPTDVASLAAAKSFLGEMRSEHLKRGAPYTEPRIVALSFNGTGTRYINASLMEADGFPLDVPARFLYVHDYGPRTSDPEEISPYPTFTTGARVNEVRDLVYMYYSTPEGPAKVYDLIRQRT